MTPLSTFHLGQPPGGLPGASYSIPAAMAAFAAVVGEELAEEFLADVATELFVGRIPTRQQPTWVHLRRPWKPASSRLLVALPTPACPAGRTSGGRLITLRSHRGHGEPGEGRQVYEPAFHAVKDMSLNIGDVEFMDRLQGGQRAPWKALGVRAEVKDLRLRPVAAGRGS